MAEFKINEQREVRDFVLAEERLYLTPDRERVVRPDDPDARFLFASEGSEILREDAIRYGLVTPTKEEKKALSEEQARLEGEQNPEPPAAPEATDAAAELAEAEGIDLASIDGSGADGKITKGDVEKAVAERDA